MRYRGALGWLIGLTVMLVVPSTALAATVTTTADSGAGSLRDAIAGPDSTIDFAGNLSGQTITLTSGALMITHNLTISGPGASNLTVVGDGSDPVFEVNIVPATSTSQRSLVSRSRVAAPGISAGAASPRPASPPLRWTAM